MGKITKDDLEFLKDWFDQAKIKKKHHKKIPILKSQYDYFSTINKEVTEMLYFPVDSTPENIITEKESDVK